MHKSAFCTFLQDSAQICAFSQAILAGKKHRNAQKSAKTPQKCTKTRHFAPTHAIPPFIIPLFPEGPKDQKNSRFRSGLKILSENEIFERATHRGPIFCGEIETSRLKFSSEIKNFDRDQKFRSGSIFFDRWALWVSVHPRLPPWTPEIARDIGDETMAILHVPLVNRAFARVTPARHFRHFRRFAGLEQQNHCFTRGNLNRALVIGF